MFNISIDSLEVVSVPKMEKILHGQFMPNRTNPTLEARLGEHDMYSPSIILRLVSVSTICTHPPDIQLDPPEQQRN